MGIWWMYLLGEHQTKKLRSLAMQRPTGWSYGRPPFYRSVNHKSSTGPHSLQCKPPPVMLVGLDSPQ